MITLERASSVVALSVESTAVELTPNATAAEQLEEVRHTVQGLAAEDADFRAALLDAPAETITELIKQNSLGSFELPRHLEVTVFHDTPTLVHVVVPSINKVGHLNSELAQLARALDSDSELLSALRQSPQATLESFIKELNGSSLEIPAGAAVRVVLEDSQQLCIVVASPQRSALGTLTDDEFRGAGVGVFCMSPGGTCGCNSDGCSSDKCSSCKTCCSSG